MQLKRLLFAAFGLLAVSTTFATTAEHKVKGYMFGDYYYAVSGPDEKRNAFQFRRIYLTNDVKWNDSFSGRLRFEAKDSGFGKDGTMNPFVKDVYLRYKGISRSIYVGQSQTPTWSVSEKVWGYRSVEKTLMDRSKAGSSRDNGVALKTGVGSSGKVNFHLMVANGNSTKSEKDNNKKLYGLLNLNPAGDLVATAYVDWQSQPKDQDQTTVAVLVGTTGKDLHGGVEVFSRKVSKAAGSKDLTSQGVSLFGAKRLQGNIKIFARADFSDSNTDAEDDSALLLVGGIDWSPTKGIHVMPNVKVITEYTPGVDTAVIPRVTGYFKF